MKKLLSAFMSMVMVFTVTSALAFPASAAADITLGEANKSAKALTFNKTLNLDFVEDQSIYSNHVYTKIVLTDDAIIDIKFKHNRGVANYDGVRELIYLRLHQLKNGAKEKDSFWPTAVSNDIKATERKAVVGEVSGGGGQGSGYSGGLRADRDEGYAEGVFTYKLTKGTYYLRVQVPTAREIEKNPDTSFSLTATLRTGNASTESSSSNSSSSSTDAIAMAVKLKKGETIQLGTIPSADGVKWTSSKDSVATVSSSGKVTAKAKGTATIKATANGKTTSVKISVG